MKVRVATIADAKAIEEICAENLVQNRQDLAKKVGYNGVGSALLETLIKTAKEKNFKTIICRIIHQPIKNLASIAFHQKFGFRLEGERERSDGYVAGLYVKNL